MKQVTAYPNRVRVIENSWIPMSDGVRLACKIWLPESASDEAVPAILEYIPYRKRDNEASLDSIAYTYFAGHGYAGVRVDLRGSGDSEGILFDEYLQQEHDDALEVLRWIAAQPWCDGNVGMMGISWGGFNSLQVAALQPPELKAIITVCSTDDRYADDIHHMGGCLLGDTLSWASTMFSFNSLPPDPEIAGEKWREMWLQRLEGSGLWIEKWLRHQRRDAYWKHGSVCEDYRAIRVPVYAVSGWADGYSNAVFRLLRNLDVPRKGLVGPWSHKYPHFGVPGPAIGFLKEAVRWWDRWLKGKKNGIDKEPILRAWMQDSCPPAAHYAERPGRWIAETEWPAGRVVERRYKLAPGGLKKIDDNVPETALRIRSPLTVGLFAGKWCSYAAGPDLPYDQRHDDAGSLVFDTDPLEADLEILGAPVVELELSADRPVAMVAVRLSDVQPDGKATRVTYGLLNLTHRESSEEPAPLEPHARFRVQVRLNEIAQVFPAGHRMRIAVSTSYWPLAWPPPEPVTLDIITGRSTVVIPERPPRSEDAGIPEFGPPERHQPVAEETLEPSHHNWLIHWDLAADSRTLGVIHDSGRFRLPHEDLTLGTRALETYSSTGDEFDSVRGETRWEREISRSGWSIRTVTRTVLTSTKTDFRIVASLEAYEGEKQVFSRNWDVTVPRDHL